MPLTMAQEGRVTLIKRLCGKGEVRRHLRRMGFIPGMSMGIVSVHNGNVIVNIKEGRVAIGREIANKIIIFAE